MASDVDVSDEYDLMCALRDCMEGGVHQRVLFLQRGCNRLPRDRAAICQVAHGVLAHCAPLCALSAAQMAAPQPCRAAMPLARRIFARALLAPS